MAITKELVDLMGGTIRIQSKLGEGTTVTIHFDFRVAEEQKNDAEADCMTGAEKLEERKVLLVEDNVLNREIAREILSELGMKVEEADDGTVAVEKCIKAAEKDRDAFYDFILMDVQMPVMDGYEATQKIRKLGYECTDRVPIIAMTANAFAEDKKNAFVAGMNAHLAKPIDMKELIRTLLSFAK